MARAYLLELQTVTTIEAAKWVARKWDLWCEGKITLVANRNHFVKFYLAIYNDRSEAVVKNCSLKKQQNAKIYTVQQQKTMCEARNILSQINLFFTKKSNWNLLKVESNWNFHNYSTAQK